MAKNVKEPFPSARWVRGIVDDVTLVDSREQLLVWEEELPVPRYVFRESDVRPEYLQETDAPDKQHYHHPHSGVTAWFDIVVGDRTIRHGAWRKSGLEGYLGVTWQRDGLDHWYEEDLEVFEHPHDPFVHIDAITSSRRVTVKYNDVVLAESNNPIFLWETGLPTRYYLPCADVDFSRLVESETTSICPYKGFATEYWSVSGEPDLEDIAWSYPEPFFPYRNIAGAVAFVTEKLDILVEGELQPQSE